MLTAFLMLTLTLLAAASCHRGGEQYNRVNEAGERDGEWRFYYDSGELREIITYRDGRKDGPQFQFYPNGNLSLETYWDSDSTASWLDSVTRQYSEYGQLVMEGWYRDGTPDSLFRYWYPDGTLKEVRIYRDGLKTGLWKYYRPDGSLEKTVDYRGFEQYWTEDTRAGIMTWYGPGGDTLLQETWLEGRKVE